MFIFCNYMQIQSINILNFSPISKKPLKQVPFRGLISDVFQRSSDSKNKKVKVKNLKGEEVDAIITKTTPALERNIGQITKYIISIDNDAKGKAIVEANKDNSVYLTRLHTERTSQREYRGLGTQLIKYIVQESMQKGKNGTITTCAHYGNEPPFKFYFKNNFKISDYDSLDVDYQRLYNAPLQYSVTYNKNIFDIIPKNNDTFYMELDEKGAQALLEGKRLADSRICDTVATTIIDEEQYSAQFIESPYENEFFLQVLNDDMDEEKLCYIASLTPFLDDKGQKHFKINEVLNWFEASSDMVVDFAQSLIPELEKKYL